MKDYIAWLNGTSVARGTLMEVEHKAKEIAATALWKERNNATNLRITRGAKQYFVKSIVIK